MLTGCFDIHEAELFEFIVAIDDTPFGFGEAGFFEGVPFDVDLRDELGVAVLEACIVELIDVLFDEFFELVEPDSRLTDTVAVVLKEFGHLRETYLKDFLKEGLCIFLVGEMAMNDNSQVVEGVARLVRMFFKSDRHKLV